MSALRRYRKFIALAAVLTVFLVSLATSLQRAMNFEDQIAQDVTTGIWAVGQVEVEYLRFIESSQAYRGAIRRSAWTT